MAVPYLTTVIDSYKCTDSVLVVSTMGTFNTNPDRVVTVMATVHLSDGSTEDYDVVIVKISGFVKCYNREENPEYDPENNKLGLLKTIETDEVAYPQHKIECVTGSVTYQRSHGAL